LPKFLIDDRIFSVRFSCDLKKCFGACCTLKGAGGAPLLKEEVSKIGRLVGNVKKHLNERHQEFLEEHGFAEETNEGYTLKSVDDKECVFVYYEEEIARCAFQKSYFEDESDFPKPISCHLFPIRIQGNKRNIIRYEELYECQDALAKGEDEDTTVFEFLKEPLIREYGKEFYKGLKKRYLED
jgi:hypothetical protein